MVDDAQRACPVMRPAVQETYGPADLSAHSIFAGGFINFGYWHGIDLSQPLGQEERIRSQEDLYRHVLGSVGPLKDLGVLEVGCGLGMGCALALREYDPEQVVGMDIHPQQVRRARDAHAEVLRREPERLRFAQGAAEHMPFASGEFDVLVSVEAAQHFPDLTAFAAETARVVRPGGRVVVASFFTVDDAGDRTSQLAGLLDTFANGLDIARPVTALTETFEAAGLTAVRAESIGRYVWPGWDLWLSRQWAEGTWPRNFLRAYEQRILDYYLIVAERPAKGERVGNEGE
ncbi:class I SAM-dependent methyltransferase [Streptomyces sp. NPDC020192]|uniref:class I SAM-dependent methyltransferase n=1 Tax=Streptomyces sp. NPDC020192 TaxID=3365066 RepID=UPI003793EE38